MSLWIETLVADLRFGLRRLASRPGFAVVTAITLALGIGGSTAIFGAVNPVLLEPLPYPHAGRLAMIWDTGPGRSRQDVTFGTYRELTERSRSFDAMAVMRPWQPTLTGGTHAERLDGQYVTADYFRVLGVSPALGRSFQTADDRLNAPKVVILGDGLWRRRFGGDPAILGRLIALDDTTYAVVGVMPGMFENVLAPTAEIWRPLQYDVSLPAEGPEWGHHLRLVGLLRPGAGIDGAAFELDQVARAPVPEFTRPRWAALDSGLIVNSLQDDVAREVTPVLFAILGAMMLVLAIACVNVTNLLLARAAERRGEFATRMALGAARARLVRQVLTESLFLALLGGILGLAVAAIGVRALVALSPAALPRVNAIGIDGQVLAFALAITTLIGVVVGLIPALYVSRGALHTSFQPNSVRVTVAHQMTRRTLVVAEVALAVVLLVGAGLLVRTVQRLFAVHPGFNAAHVLTMQVQTSGRRFDDAGVTRRFFADALDAVRRVPGVSSAAWTSQLPLSGDLDVYGVHFQSSPTSPTEEDRGAFRYAVSPDYFTTMGMTLKSGRWLDARDDDASAPPAAVINESFARRRFPGQDPLGQRLHIGPISGPGYTIVGIAGDVRQTSLAVSQTDAVYVTTTQSHVVDGALWLVVRARADAAALAPPVAAAIRSVDKDQPIVRMATMDARLADSISERRFTLTLLELFGVVALALAATGIYGLLSGSVAERTREIGIRAALGASRAGILAMILRQGMVLTGIGVAVGLAVAVAASRALVTLLFGVSRVDPITYLAVMTLLLGASAIACCLPAWRAACVDPAITLRAE
jgi:putative ABC transport system permease protein